MTPDTLNYLLLGLVVTGILMAVFIASFVIRQRSLEQDMKLLEQLAEDEQ